MKPRSFSKFPFSRSSVILAGLTLSMSASFAAVATKEATGTDLTQAASWTGGSGPGFPTSADTATWTSTSLGAGLTLGSVSNWGGISVTGALSDIDITGAGTLTLGDVNMSTSTVNLSLANPVVLPAAKTWTVATGKTLTMSGNVTGGQHLVIAGNGTSVLSGSGTSSFSALTLGTTNGSSTTSKLSISSGTVNFTGRMGLGGAAGARGILNISGTANVTASGDFIMFGGNGSGSNLTSSGVVNQSGGTFNVSTGSGVLMPWAGNAYGAYLLSGGTLNGPNAGWNVDNQNTTYGLFSQSGGDANFKNSFTINNGSTGGAVVDVSGGTMTHKTAGNFMATTGTSCTGVLTVRGTGTVSEQTGNFLVTNGNNTCTGIVNLLTGGTIEAHTIKKAASASSKAILNCDGGKVKPYSTNGGASFLTGLDNLFLYPGGLTFDSAGQSVTIGQALVPPTGYGVGTSGSTIAVASGTGYIAAPVVAFAAPSGGGVAATGVAEIDANGTVTQIRITSPGSGYTNGESVAVTFNAGNNSANEAVTVATPPAVTASTLNASGGLTKIGSGVLTLNNTETYTGATQANEGKLMLASTASINSASAISVANGATFGGAGSAGAVTLAGGGTLEGGNAGTGTLTASSLTTSGTVTLTGTVSTTAGYKPISVTDLTVNGGSQSVLIGAAAGAGLTNGSTYDFLTWSGTTNVADAGVLKQFSRNLTPVLDLANKKIQVTYSSTGSSIYWTGATTAWDTSSSNWKQTSDNSVTQFLPSDIVLFHDLAAPSSTVDISVADVSPASTAFDNTTATSYTVQGSKGISSGSITKTNNGSLTITNANTTTGAVTLNGGQVTLSQGTGLGSGDIAFGGSNLTYTGSNTSWVRQLAFNAATTIGVSDANATIAQTGTVTGTGALTKTGTGSLSLGSANGSWTGGANVSQGTLIANHASALGAAANALVLGDASTGANPVDFKVDSGISSAVTLASITNSNFGSSQTITINAGSSLAINAAGLVTTLNLTGTVPVTLKATNTGGHGTAQDANWRITGNAIPAGTTALILDGSATGLRTSQLGDATAASNFTGDVLIKGNVVTQNRTYLAATAGNQNLNFLNNDITVNSSSTWNLVWGGETAGALNGVGNVVLNNQNALNNIGLTIGNNDRSGSYSGVISSSGSFGIAKAGTGTQTLSGASTYTGGTTVANGTLLVNNTTGSGTGTGAVTVQTGATLGGTGSASGATTISTGATVAPGNSVGTLTLGSATLAGTYQCQLGATAGDLLSVTGALTVNPGAAITISTLATPTAASYTILSYGSLLGDPLPTITPPAGYTVDTATPGLVKLVKSSGYSAWAAINAPTGTPADDYDGDGVSNGLEWVLGGLAATNDISKLPVSTTSGGNLVFTFVRNDAAWQSGDTTVQIQVGTTLAAWPSVYNVGIDTAGSSAGVTVTDNGTTDTVTLTVAQAPDAAKFARLKVTVTP